MAFNMKTHVILTICAITLAAAVGGGIYIYAELGAAERAAQEMKLAGERAALRAKEVSAAKDDLRAKIATFDDALKVAGMTSRISLGPILLRMGDTSRAIRETRVPDCLAYSKDRVTTATERGVEAINRFVASDRYTPEAHWVRVYQSYEIAVGVALSTLAKACNE